MWGLESKLVVAVDCGLPEELHKTCKVHRIIVVRLQKLAVDLLHQKLEFVLGQHRVVHVVLSVHFHQIGYREDLFTQGSVASVLLFEQVCIRSVFVE